MSDRPEKTEVRIRRAPKLGVFLLIGAVLGGLVTLVLTSLFPADPAVGFGASFGYFLLFGLPAGAVVGAIVGLIIDRVSTARARTVTAEREVVEAAGDSTPEEPAAEGAELPTEPGA